MEENRFEINKPIIPDRVLQTHKQSGGRWIVKVCKERARHRVCAVKMHSQNSVRNNIWAWTSGSLVTNSAK